MGRPSSKSGALEDGIEKKNSITFIVHNLKRQMGGGELGGGGMVCMYVCMYALCVYMYPGPPPIVTPLNRWYPWFQNGTCSVRERSLSSCNSLHVH